MWRRRERAGEAHARAWNGFYHERSRESPGRPPQTPESSLLAGWPASFPRGRQRTHGVERLVRVEDVLVVHTGAGLSIALPVPKRGVEGEVGERHQCLQTYLAY